MIADFDPGPLNWVKGEIELALQRAMGELDAYSQHQDRTKFKFCRTHLHQVHGALNIVDLPGLPLITEAQEKLLSALESTELEATPERVAALYDSIKTLQSYLDGAAEGRLQQPTVLTPQLTELHLAIGKPKPSAATLFYPKLDWFPEARPENSEVQLDQQERSRRLKRERHNYQQGLLDWLRLPTGDQRAIAGLAKMATSIAEVEKVVKSPSQRACWRIASGLMAALAQPSIADDPGARQLCSLIDLQLRRTQAGSERVAERLMRESLYFIARAGEGKHPLIDSIARDYALSDTELGSEKVAADRGATGATGSSDENNDELAKACRTRLGMLEQILDAYFRGNAQKTQIAASVGHIDAIASAMRECGQVRAAEEISDIGKEIADINSMPGRPDDSIFKSLAQRLTRFYLYVGRLFSVKPAEAPDFDSFVAEDAARLQTVTALEGSLESELAARQGEIRAMLNRAEQQEARTAGARLPLQKALRSLRQDADLIADEPLRDRLNTALGRLEAATVGTARAAEDKRAAVPSANVTESVPAKTSQETSPQIDPDLMQVFLEEARTVLVNMQNQLSVLQKMPGDQQKLVDVRRGFHTLKGSGRMVGLSDLGEFAWEIEQTLNLHLRNESPVDRAFFQFMDKARLLLSKWLRALENSPPSTPPSTEELVAEARHLRASRADPLQALEEKFTGRASAKPQPGSADQQIKTEPEPAPASKPEAETKPESAPTPASEPEAEPVPAPALAPAPKPKAETRPGIAQAVKPAMPPTPEKVQDKEESTPLLAIFNVEAAEHLATLQSGLASMHDEPAPQQMIRAAHTLAGIAGAVGQLSLSRLAHTLEQALERRNTLIDSAQLDQDFTPPLLHEALVKIEESLSNPQREPADEVISRLAELYPSAEGAADTQQATGISATEDITVDRPMFELFVEEARELCSGFNLRLGQWRQNTQDKDAAHNLYRLLHTFKGGARMVGAMHLGEMAHSLEERVQHLKNQDKVSAAEIESVQLECDNLHGGLENLLKSLAPSAPVGDAADDESSKAGAKAESAVWRAETPLVGGGSMRVGAELLNSMVADSGEMAIAFNRITNEIVQVKKSLQELDANVVRLRRHLREIDMQAESQLEAHISEDGVFDPLELDRFTRFQEVVRMMAESVGDIAAVQEGLKRDINEASEAISFQARLNRGMQLNLMDTRMMPVNSLAERLQRTVRQAARESGRAARLIITGGDVKLDRAILERIITPFEHMLRNAVSHGIEPIAMRREKGKSTEGRINLDVSREGDNVLLSLADDGAGLDLPQLLARAEALGFVKQGQELDDIEQCELIFLPGLSTAVSVNELSGRGVGMDIVKNEIASLGGHIEVASVAGRGVSFRVHLPLTMLLMQALVVRVGSQLFAVPSSLIVQVAGGQSETLSSQLGKQRINLRDVQFPFHYLPHLLGDSLAMPEGKKRQRVIFMQSGSHRLAILVEEVLSHQEIVVKNVGPQMASVLGIDGATVLGDGRIVLIINPIVLFERATIAASRDAEASYKRDNITRQKRAAAEADKQKVMVVDDSLTVRKITGRLLEKSGYAVLTARDGAEALAEINQQRPSAVLCDIDMPRMDGFDFLRAVQGDPQLRDMPVIMVTSRTSERHQQLAKKLGARHYLGKPYSEDELLLLLDSVVKHEETQQA